ncbi:MAG: MFS transporter [Chloroflexota bacterium]
MNKRAFVSLCVSIFTAMLGLGIISPLMALYATSLGATGFWLGVMYSGFSISRTIVLPVAGWLADNRSRKKLMIVGLVGYAVISLLYASVSQLYQLITVRMLHGVFSAMVIPIAQAYVGDLIPEGKEGTYMNFYTMVMFLGMGMGPLMGGFLSDIFDVNTVFYVMGGFAAVALTLLILTVPDMAAQVKRNHVKRASLWTMIRDNKMKAVSLYMATRGVYAQSIMAFLPLFAVNVIGLSRSIVGVLLSSYSLSGAVFGGMLGPVSDKVNKKVLMITGAAMAPVILFFLPQMKSAAGILLVLVPLAFMGGLGRAPAMAINVQSGRKFGRMGSTMGLINTAMATGNFIGPLVTGYIMDHYGIENVFYFGAIVGTVSIVFISYWLLQKDDVAVAVPVAVSQVIEEEPSHHRE